MQLARAVRNRTTGVLYVLDEPSIGLHPSNIVGLNAVMHDLIADGNSVILVDHDTQILSEADWMIEMGPEAGAGGGYVIAEGSGSAGNRRKGVPMIGPFLAQTADLRDPGTAWPGRQILAPRRAACICPRTAIHTVAHAWRSGHSARADSRSSPACPAPARSTMAAGKSDSGIGGIAKR